jgi:hypothetical protein
MTHFKPKSQSGTASHRFESGCPIAAHLNVLTDLAVRLNILTAQVEVCPTEWLLSLEGELERLVAQFDRACSDAERLGVPFNIEFETTDEAGRCYLLALTAEGVLFQVA